MYRKLLNKVVNMTFQPQGHTTAASDASAAADNNDKNIMCLYI